jgi:Zn-dependent peptidase ImmA (M78 family)/transcriptional regulator with XRE-family HTH domain
MNSQTDYTELQPTVLKWARERAQLSLAALAEKLNTSIGRVAEWEGNGRILFSEVQHLAEKTHTPVGFLFLKQPPDQGLPISDFRRVATNEEVLPPSPDLLDVLHAAQRRQNWYREYQISHQEKPLAFVDSVTVDSSVKKTAATIRDTLKIGPVVTQTAENREETLRQTIEAVEVGGILVLRAGYAGGYTHRTLSVDEFRGFALSDPYAPLVFINGADALSAQLFTLAHEIAHIWLGESAVSNLDQTYPGNNPIEVFCNQVAAEVLVPMDTMRIAWRHLSDYEQEIELLSRRFKVSRIVIARRARDAQFLSQERYSRLFAEEMQHAHKGTGGNYYQNEQYQNSKRFSVALLQDTKNGRTLYHDAMQLLGIKKQATFRKYAENLQLGW